VDIRLELLEVFRKFRIINPEDVLLHLDGRNDGNRQRPEPELHGGAIALGEFMDRAVGQLAHEVNVADDRTRRRWLCKREAERKRARPRTMARNVAHVGNTIEWSDELR
jgi:hypothetical protein